MPLNKEAYLRYKIIDRVLNDKRIQDPKMEDFIRAIDEEIGKTISLSTIQKDIKAMKEDGALAYFAPIQFKRSSKSYCYTEPFSINNVPLNDEEKDSLLDAADLLHKFSGLRMTQDFNNAAVKILNTLHQQTYDEQRGYIITESYPPQNGIEYFDLIHRAIKERIPINLVHYNYQKRNFTSLILHPSFLKEFQGFWYVIGYSEKHEEVRTFGLDRIYSPVLLKKKFIPLDRTLWLGYFKSMIGVLPLNDSMKVEKISFHVFSHYSDYVLSHPIHRSQKVLEKLDEGIIVCEIEVIPTIELINFFLSRLTLIRVLDPQGFVDLIVDRIYKSINVKKVRKK